MKKRGYIYVYAVFVIALLFMVVVSITESVINKNRIVVYSEDYIKQKYLTESNAYLAIDYLISSEIFENDITNASRTNSGKEVKIKKSIDPIFKGQAKYDVDYTKNLEGYLDIIFKNYYDGIVYENKGSIKLFNDLYYEDSLLIDINDNAEDYDKLQKAGYIDKHIEDILFLEDNIKRIFTQKDGKLAYRAYTEDDEEAEGKIELIEDHIGTEDIINDDSEKDAVDNTEAVADTESNDESRDEEARDESVNEEEIDLKDSIEQKELEKIEEPNEEYEESEETKDEVDDKSENKPEDWTIIDNQDEIKFGLVIGPHTVYSSDSTLILSGLIKMNVDTVVDSDIEISGVLILEGNPIIKKGNIEVTGAILTAVGKPDCIALIPKASRFEKYGSIYRNFIEPKVQELSYSY